MTLSPVFSLPAAAADLAKLRKGDPGKVACAALVRLRTAMLEIAVSLPAPAC
ncbi:MAG: hypothetical protein MUF04_10675 [Akkermansiaceae bacterium]|nr:hypothetical protein [Akkermansiaceae bacterium]